MTIDQMISALEKAKIELGGDTTLRLHIECEGNGTFVELLTLCNSGVFGLHADITTPWFCFNKENK